MSRYTSEAVVRGLRAWTAEQDLYVRAAVELLIEHDVWLGRGDFVDICVERTTAGHVCINWRAAREAFDAGEFRGASSTEIAVLDFAIALGCDRYRFDKMGPANAMRLVEATARALGVAR